MVVKNTTCFSEHEKRNLTCEKSSCRQWIENPACLNCVIISANNKSMTLQEIGDLFKVTRMRVCQIEKNIIKKCKDLIKLDFETSS